MENNKEVATYNDDIKTRVTDMKEDDDDRDDE